MADMSDVEVQVQLDAGFDLGQQLTADATAAETLAGWANKE
jgi:hypothetical protein